MVTNKRKKNSRLRGSWTHGWGAKKKHRGAGNRGGRGMAGTGKRGDAKKPCIWKEKYFGKFGFKKKGIKRVTIPINLGALDQQLSNLFADKKITQEKDVYVIDLSKLGYNKLLGEGKATNKMKITALYASKIAVEKVKAIGGEVILGSKPQEKGQ